MKFYTLASGSSGNAALVQEGDTRLLIDAGISCRRIGQALALLGLSFADITGILLTHSHIDHVRGLTVLCKRCAAPVFATPAAAAQLALPRERLFSPQTPFTLGSFTVCAFPTAHDSPGSVGFRIDGSDGSLGYLTDTGHVTEEVLSRLEGAELLVLEANHDVNMLLAGPYPYYLKRRILSDWGHLSNETAGLCAVRLARRGAQEIVLAHLSQENNTPELALQAVQAALSAAGCTPRLTVAPRETLSEEYRLCRKLRSFASES